MLLALLTILAEEGKAQDTAPGWSGFVPIILMVVLGYMLLFRPMQRQEKQRQAMVAALKKNDKVLTSGGIIGVVASIKETGDEVALKIDEGSPVRLRVTKSSIVRVLSAEEAAAKEKESKEKETKEE
jgi:preprotein translocase subunit YajC